MQDYLYDGTFEGFLTCVYHHYYTEQAAGICLKEEYQSSLLGGFQEVHTDLEKADRVYQAIRRKISYMDLRRIYKCFLSTVPDKEMIGDIETSRKSGCVCSTGNREKDQCGSRANAPVRAILCYAG